MNWTEGNLARHSRGQAAKENHRLQKQHFHKARNRLLSRNLPRSPVKISFLNRGQASQPARAQGCSVSPPTVLPSARYPDARLPWFGAQVKQDILGKENSTQSDGGDIRAFGETTGPFNVYRKHPLLADIVAEEDRTSWGWEKRQRLLSEPDWTGLETQRPLNLLFHGQVRASSGPWGNRRGQPQVYSGPKYIANFANRYGAKEQREPCHGLKLGTLATHPIRIQIGSQDVTYDPDPGSQVSRWSDARRSPRRWPKSDELASRATDSVRGRTRRLSESESSWSFGTDSCRQTTTHHKARRSLSLFGASRNHGHPQDEDFKRVYDHRGIHEPIPVRVNFPRFLQPPPSVRSDDNESIQVHIGQSNRITPSEMVENDKWENIVMSADDGIIPLTRGSSLLGSTICPPSISPGPSEVQPRLDLSIIQRPRTDSHNSSLSSLASGKAMEEDTVHPKSTGGEDAPKQDIDPTTPGRYPSSASGPSQLIPSTAVRGCGIRTLKQCTEAINSARLPPGPALLGDRSSKISTRKQAIRDEQDENEAWMKAILGDTGDELEEKVFREEARRIARELKPSVSSDSSQEPTPPNASSNSRSIREDLYMGTATARRAKPTMNTSEDHAPAFTGRSSHGATHSSIVCSSPAMDHIKMPHSSSSRSPGLFPSSPSKNTVAASMLLSSDLESDKATAGGSVTTAAQDSLDLKTQDQTFIFSKPATFVGKLAASCVKTRAMPAPSAPRSRDWRNKTDQSNNCRRGILERHGRGLRRRSRKRAQDGRTDIRELPDHDGDPIEESEGA